jgi:VIT1/CCC1 family predicted Fe2+/Mn2+ transporter
MPTTPHIEKHFKGSASIRDVVIGMADGLTVPFALAAGLSAAVSSTHIVVTAGLAEVAAGAIAMGLGGFLASRSDEQHFRAEETREQMEIDLMRPTELAETAAILRPYGLEGQLLDQVVAAIATDRTRWIEFMMRFELGLERPNPSRAIISAGTIGLSYLVGGLIPLLPYMLFAELAPAFRWSVGATGLALTVFGAVKGKLTGAGVIKSALQTLLVGGLAAGAAYYLASLFG